MSESEDPRKQGTGEGYPESQPDDATPVEGTERGPEADEDPGQKSDPSGGRDESPSDATGNPGAAGG